MIIIIIIISSSSSSSITQRERSAGSVYLYHAFIMLISL